MRRSLPRRGGPTKSLAVKKARKERIRTTGRAQGGQWFLVLKKIFTKNERRKTEAPKSKQDKGDRLLAILQYKRKTSKRGE